MATQEAPGTLDTGRIDWAMLAEARNHDTYTFRSHDILEIERPDGSKAIFDEITASGLRGGLHRSSLSEADRELADDRSKIYAGIQVVSALDRFYVPGAGSSGPRIRPKGDWEPEHGDTAEMLVVDGLGEGQRVKQIRKLRKQISWLGTRSLNKLVGADGELAVRLEAPESRDDDPTAVKLAGFRKRFVLDVQTGKRNWSPVIQIQDRFGNVALPPSDAIVTGLFAKRNEQ